jgi:hypothetical protein
MQPGDLRGAGEKQFLAGGRCAYQLAFCYGIASGTHRAVRVARGLSKESKARI